MIKRSVFIMIFVFVMVLTKAQIVITEIMYNPPDGPDVYEYIELYNNSDQGIQLLDFKFNLGIEHVFTSKVFEPHSYIVLCKDSVFIRDFNITAIKWDNGGLNNGGETIQMVDNNDNIIVKVAFSDRDDWDPAADGTGPSLELCAIDADNENGKNWKPSLSATGITIEEKMFYGTPGTQNSVECGTVEPTEPELVITEIMYNDGGTTDSLEFIEIMNYGKDSVSLKDFTLKSRSILYTFPNRYLESGEFVVICNNGTSFTSHFKFNALQWNIGGLNNNSDTLLLINDNGDTLDYVVYLEEGDWSALADGSGYSLSLCDPASDNNVGKNWQASPVYAGFEYMNKEIHANPGKNNYCSYDFKVLKETDSIGVLKNNNLNAFLSGTVCGTNFNSSGLQFSLMNDSNEGVWIYSNTKSFGYDFHEGDELELWGTMSEFNSIGQLIPDSVIVKKIDNKVIDPKTVTEFNEANEGNLIKIENVKILNYSLWTNTGSGFNINVANNSDTFAIRIDKDVDIFGMQAPAGTFSITGLLGQYDYTSPFLDGYQLFPRYTQDISPYNTDAYPLKTIGEMTETDTDGVAISNGSFCELRGVVYGINLRPNGLQFTIIDNENNGIGMFSSSKNYGYSVKEGDQIAARGKIDQYRGLLQMVIDTVFFLGENNSLVNPSVVTELNESTESQLIKIMRLTLKDPTQWKGTGESINVTVTDGISEFLMRIDNDCELSTMEAPDYQFNLTGIGGQYDTSSPYLDGYEIFPRYSQDIEKSSAINEIENSIQVYPNPTSGDLYISDIENTIVSIELLTIHGKLMKRTEFCEYIDMNEIESGIYLLRIVTPKGTANKRIVRK